MQSVRRAAPAKVNLALHVVGRRADGYHELDSLVAFADFGDTVTVREASFPQLSVAGPTAGDLGDDGQNLVERAAAALRRACTGHLPHAAIELHKRIPVAAGLGGGSADAAATLLALGELWGVAQTVDLPAVALSLGADVPMCLHSRPLRARGRGERIDALDGFGDIPAVLVNPGVAVSTPAVFSRLDRRDNPPIALSGTRFPAVEAIAAMRNDLEPAAIGLCPAIADALAALRSTPDCLLARMSGSGATCFGLYSSAPAAAAAAERVRSLRPGWWCVATRLRGGPGQDRGEP